MEKTSQKINSVEKEMNDLRNAKVEDTAEWKKLQSNIDDTKKRIHELRLKAIEMRNVQIPTQEYKEIKEYIQESEKQLDKLLAKEEKMQALGMTSGKGWESLQYEIKELKQTIGEAENDLENLKEEGKAFSTQKGTDAYKAVIADMQTAREELHQLRAEEENLGASFDAGKSDGIKRLAGELAQANAEMNVLELKSQQVFTKINQINGNGFKKLSTSAKKASNSVNKLAKSSTSANKGFSNLLKTMKQMVLSMAVFTIMQKGIEFLKSGLQNLAVYSKEYNATMSELMSSTSQLKNAFAVAFQPILNMVIPILSKLINWISAAANAVSRFFAILGGKSTYTKAIQQNKDYAASLDKIGGSADDAKGSLAGFDDLDVLQKNDSSSGGGGSDGADGSGFIEESVGDATAFENIKSVLNEIVDIFKTGFAEGLGDWESRLADIQVKTQMIKDALSNIFTDPEVVGGATSFGDALIYNLGVVAGSVASIGLTIAQNLVGGIALYLTENTDRIKQYLIDMFDIGTEIANLVGSFSDAFAYVFEAFGSENGQQLTANLIGIFSSAFMGVSQLCGSLSRDLLNIIIQPFVENQEGFRTALEGFLGTAATVCGTIKETIDNTFDKLLTVYDEHIKPFFDSIASGLSEITDKFLEFWNTNVQPVMDNLAAKFDEVMSQHIQPMLDKASELIGSIADALRVLWEEVLQPLIMWIIDNILPVVLPIFENLYQGLLDCFGFIADIFTGFLTVLQGVIDFIVSVFTGDWDGAWNSVQNIVSGIFDTIKAKINLVLTAVKTIVTTILSAIQARFEIIFNAVKDFIEAVFLKIKGTISGAMHTVRKGIADALETIKSKWNEVWTSLKTSVVDIFNSIWTAIKGVINSILGGVESMANGVINAINSMINALNNLSFTAPDWVPEIGGKNFNLGLSTISTVSIPRLANGGITTGSTLANIGEAGREAVIPLERNTEWMDTFAEVLAGKIGGTGGTIDLNVILDGNTVYRRMVQLDREFAGRTGRSQFGY